MTDPQELSRRLLEQRTINITNHNQVRAYLDADSILHHETAALIDAQAARIAELEKALRPFAEFADVDDTVEAQEWLLSPRSRVVLVARKALSNE